ncbi:hypothetical protein, partial [Amycolatopsis sacchari]|uniref:hypothetical protein n=1 Tax=Amycolatopsis sacchari TaxID=115433 RepID=UPI003D76038F
NTAKLGGLGEESDAWWLGVCGGVVVGFFGFVVEYSGAFDYAGVAALSPGGRVGLFEYFCQGFMKCGAAALRGKNPPGW